MTKLSKLEKNKSKDFFCLGTNVWINNVFVQNLLNRILCLHCSAFLIFPLLLNYINTFRRSLWSYWTKLIGVLLWISFKNSSALTSFCNFATKKIFLKLFVAQTCLTKNIFPVCQHFGRDNVLIKKLIKSSKFTSKYIKGVIKGLIFIDFFHTYAAKTGVSNQRNLVVSTSELKVSTHIIILLL